MQPDHAQAFTGPIVRPREHVENLRRYLLAGDNPVEADDDIVVCALRWAIGELGEAPITKKRATALTTADVREEINAAYAAQGLGFFVAETLEWLIGETDHPPVGEGFPPGDIVGGRGDIVRSNVSILAMLSAARQGRETEDDFTRPWCSGVVATLEWVLGRSQVAPITEAYYIDLPDGGALRGELAPARDVSDAQGPRAARFSRPYGQAVVRTVGWLLGTTTKAPVTRDGEANF